MPPSTLCFSSRHCLHTMVPFHFFCALSVHPTPHIHTASMLPLPWCAAGCVVCLWWAVWRRYPRPALSTPPSLLECLMLCGAPCLTTKGTPHTHTHTPCAFSVLVACSHPHFASPSPAHSHRQLSLLSKQASNNMGGGQQQAERPSEAPAGQHDMDGDDTMVGIGEIQKLGVNAAGTCVPFFPSLLPPFPLLPMPSTPHAPVRVHHHDPATS